MSGDALLVKLLNLTQSDNDHEALAAVRKANALLRANKKTWGQMLSDEDYEKLRLQYNELVRKYNRLVKAGYR